MLQRKLLLIKNMYPHLTRQTVFIINNVKAFLDRFSSLDFIQYMSNIWYDTVKAISGTGHGGTQGWESSFESEVPSIRNRSLFTYKKLVEVILRPTASRPVYPGIRPQSGICDKFFFPFRGNFLKIFAFFFITGNPLWPEDWPVNLSAVTT
jgi:hypothetical protein